MGKVLRIDSDSDELGYIGVLKSDVIELMKTNEVLNKFV